MAQPRIVEDPALEVEPANFLAIPAYAAIVNYAKTKFAASDADALAAAKAHWTADRDERKTAYDAEMADEIAAQAARLDQLRLDSENQRAAEEKAEEELREKLEPLVPEPTPGHAWDAQDRDYFPPVLIAWIRAGKYMTCNPWLAVQL